MQHGDLPPMNPDDFAALAAFAGPLYKESKTIEAYTSDNPIPGAHKEYGSMNIMHGLEQAKRLAQATARQSLQQHPFYQQPPPPPVEYVPQITPSTPAPSTPPPPLGIASVAQEETNDDQLVFNFNPSEQQVTNDLLREISKKLSNVISLLEENVSSKQTKKSNTNVGKNQT